MTEVDPVRYSRHLALPQFGPGGQQRLEAASVLVVGLGGLGSVASLYLANAGVGHLVINDFDRVDATNLPRQILFRATDVGEYKTHATAQRLKAANPAPKVSVLNRRLDADELRDAVQACDLVVDCTDNFATRLSLNTACVQARKPMVSGAAIRFEGQVAVFLNDNSQGPCYRCLYSDEDDNFANCAGQGILAPIAGMIGTVVATETLKLLLGLGSGLHNRLWVYDGLSGAVRTITIRKAPDCPVCAQAGS
ncbi:MAG: HesA/MoeB/ThiF family protein [Gammaproteobacteria bacterium PRO9]|nr:HesA/MoeB/ThiF family protein [Gammaproteobacteria bacterium PRO9]